MKYPSLTEWCTIQYMTTVKRLIYNLSLLSASCFLPVIFLPLCAFFYFIDSHPVTHFLSHSECINFYLDNFDKTLREEEKDNGQKAKNRKQRAQCRLTLRFWRMETWYRVSHSRSQEDPICNLLSSQSWQRTWTIHHADCPLFVTKMVPRAAWWKMQSTKGKA